ncbi:MAG: DUF4831 family protein [Prevotellaceae bacterium]|jgi:hypothetical protein|nr:DUF4831 family protein [Prevotellaceae bacterium]
MKKLFVFLFCTGKLLCLNGQTSVTDYSGATSPTHGVVYYLPQTAIDITALSQLTIRKPGLFANYATRLLGVKEVITAETRQWQLTDLRLAERAIADSTKACLVNINAKSVASLLTLDDNGVIRSVNMPVEQTVTLRELVTPTAADSVITFDLSQLGGEALVASSIPKMAELAAQQIYAIRENRMELLSCNGNNIPDGESLKIMLARLDDAERELVALFVGKTAILHTYKTFTFIPKQMQESVLLFRFSDILGTVTADNLAGRPIFLNINGVSPPPLPPVDPKAKKEKTFGIFYNVPGKAHITLTDGLTQRQELYCPMPQFGYTTHLPADMFDSSTIQVAFTPYGTLSSISQKAR